METSLKIFIEKAIEEINAGLPEGFIIDDAINFNVSIIHTSKKAGGIEIRVVSGGLERSNRIIHTVSFSVINEIERNRALNKNIEDFSKSLVKGFKSE